MASRQEPHLILLIFLSVQRVSDYTDFNKKLWINRSNHNFMVHIQFFDPDLTITNHHALVITK